MRAVDVVNGDQPDPAARKTILQSAFDRGLILSGCGQSGIRFCPGLCVTAEEIDAAVKILSEVAEIASKS